MVYCLLGNEVSSNCFTFLMLQTKTYHMHTADSDELVVKRAIGTKIDWKAGMNVTVKVCLLTWPTGYIVHHNTPVDGSHSHCRQNWSVRHGTGIFCDAGVKEEPKQDRGGKSNARPITKTEGVDSFFSFFSPPKVPEEGDDIDDFDEEEIDQLQAALEEDHEIG